MTPANRAVDSWLIAQYITGRASVQECAEMESRMAADGGFAREIDRLQQAIARLDTVPPTIDVQTDWIRVRDHMLRDGRRPDRRPLRRAHDDGWRRSGWVTVAAAALAVVVMVMGWRQWSHGHRSGTVAVSSYSSYVTGNGERATITLPDDNTVMLNVASRLEVPVDYTSGNHTLRLSGAALFTVVHHDKASFTVMAGPTTTRVLGTSFVVQRYAGDSTTTVAVRSGRVAVRSAVRSVILTAHQLATVGATTVPQVQPAGAAPFSFAAGVLMLDNLPLAAAIPQLNRWYDADIRLGDPRLGRQRLTGDLPAGSVGELIQDLEVTLHVRVLREGRVLTLLPR